MLIELGRRVADGDRVRTAIADQRVRDAALVAYPGIPCAGEKSQVDFPRLQPDGLIVVHATTESGREVCARLDFRRTTG